MKGVNMAHVFEEFKLNYDLKAAVDNNDLDRLEGIFNENQKVKFNSVGIPDYDGNPKSNVLMYAIDNTVNPQRRELIKFLLESEKFDLHYKCMKVDPGIVDGDLMSFSDMVSFREQIQMTTEEKDAEQELIQLGKEALNNVYQI